MPEIVGKKCAGHATPTHVNARGAVLLGALICPEATNRLLKNVTESTNLDISIESKLYKIFSKMYAMAERDYALTAIRHSDTLESFDFIENKNSNIEHLSTNTEATLEYVIDKYFEESGKSEQLAAKTAFEKNDHAVLLKELLGAETSFSNITSKQAAEVKGTLLRYPKNRNKNPRTKDLDLLQAMAIPGIETINPQTINKYLQTYGTMFEWAKRQDFINKNVFSGLTLKSNKRAAVIRKPFSGHQIELIIEGLTNPGNNPSRKPYQKWGALLGLYTGASGSALTVESVRGFGLKSVLRVLWDAQ